MIAERRDPAIIEVICRTLARAHYEGRFGIGTKEAQVQANVDNNWRIFKSQAKAIYGLFPRNKL